MIPEKTIEEIRNKVDIVTVVSEYVKLRKTGKNHVGLCPFHSEKTPSFTVSAEKQLFHCFGCGEGGNVFSFIMKTENVGFAEAIRELGEKVGIIVEKQISSGISKTEKDKLYEITQLAANFFEKNLALAGDYLKQRGITEQTAKIFGLGFALESWDSLFKYLVSRGASPALIERAGLTLPREGKDGYYDRFRDRLIFPVSDIRGRVIAFSGRALKNEEPKYLNSPETPIYRKGETVFGLHLTKESIKKEKVAVLVEGNLDLLTAYQAGITNVAAPLGTALTLPQCKLLARFADTIVLAFDSDSAGETATERSAELLRQQGIKVKVTKFKEAKDPDEFILKLGAEAFRKTIDTALPFLEFKIKRAAARYNLSEVEERSRALREVAVILSAEKDAFIQKEYAGLAAQLLRVNAENILAEVGRTSFYRQGSERDLRRTTEKPNSKIAEAEKNLLALALQNKEFLETIKKEVRKEDFISTETRSIAELLFGLDLEKTENLSHFLLENLPDEPSKKILSRILLEELPKDLGKVLNDCLEVIRRERLKNKIDGLKIDLQKAEKEGDTQKVSTLLSVLKTEIS